MSKAAESLWNGTCTEMVASQTAESVSVDLAIIGGGFTGCSAALQAAQAGASVCLMEAYEIGYGGSGRNVGLVNAGLWLKPDQVTKALGAEEGDRLLSALSCAPDDVFGLIEQHDIQCEATRNGTLHCAHSQSGLEDLKNRHRQANRTGAAYELLSAEETEARTGSSQFHGALLNARAGTIQPLSYCRGLARAAQRAGARIFQNTPVTSVRWEGGTWTVSANGKTVKAPRLLLATNAYHLDIGQSYKPEFYKVGYFQCATAPLTPAERETILPGQEGCWDTALVMSSFRIDAAGRLIVGGVGNLDAIGGPVHQAWAKRKLRSLFPQLRTDEFDYSWSGQIAMTSSHIPKIVEVGPNALACFGYSGRGIGPGTVFGRSLADALLSGDTSCLPLARTKSKRALATPLKEAYFELGATLVHAAGINP